MRYILLLVLIIIPLCSEAMSVQARKPSLVPEEGISIKSEPFPEKGKYKRADLFGGKDVTWVWDGKGASGWDLSAITSGSKYCGGYTDVECSAVCFHQKWKFYQCKLEECSCFNKT